LELGHITNLGEYKMALILNRELQNGLTVDSAYCTVGQISVVKKDKSVFTFITRAAKDKALLEESTHSFDYDIEGENPIKQAYEYLKTLPEFADAVDV
jgi:hypothetical protein